MPPPAPPPPPPPVCFPFTRKGKGRIATEDLYSSRSSLVQSETRRVPLERSGSFSPTATLTTQAEKLTFATDSESYTNVPTIPALRNEKRPSTLSRSVAASAKKGSRWGYGWSIRKKGKGEEVIHEVLEKEEYVEEPASLIRKDSKGLTRGNSVNSIPLPRPPLVANTPGPSRQTSKSSRASKESKMSGGFASRYNSTRRPGYLSNDSSATLIGSALERKMNDVESLRETVNTTERLRDLRKLMAKNDLDYYVIPSEDAHQSEYVASCDKRREWISGFSGSAGQAIVSKTTAYLVTDSRYWLQAQEQLDENWHLVPAGSVDGPKDWIDWLVDRVKDARIGLDARMIAHEKASLLNSQLSAKGSKLSFPPQNFVDLVWTDRPPKPRAPIYLQPIEFTGKDAMEKVKEVRNWIRAQPAAKPTYSRSPATPAQIHVGTLITNLACIAYVLNLRGDDIPYNPLFISYLFISLDHVYFFIDDAKLGDEVRDYLKGIGVKIRDYNDIWSFLRKREWGEGKVLITSQTSYAISLMLTHFRYTVATSIIEEMKAIKNEVELEGMRRAYLRDGASFVRFLAWLENKLAQGYEITEWEAAFKLTEYRRKNKHYKGLAYGNISASGPNAALPHYSAQKSTARIIDRETPYLNDSGGQYRDGTCDTTRTVHLGRPTPAQMEAYTRVLQGHIAIDTAVFPEGTSGQQLDVLARKALWKEGLNYMHGTGHGIGSFLNVHEGPHSFSSTVPLQPGHVISNEPGFYLAGEFGMRIESALTVSRVATKGNFNGDIWLGFDRLTCVPIQTRMVKESMLTKDEKVWLKEHNQRCKERLEPLLRDDKLALKWLRREAERGIGIAAAGPGGFSVDWD